MDEDKDKDKNEEDNDKTTKGLNNYVDQRLFIR